ncbi:hypothetical protein [Burkholderia cepacia]|uniref:hypothetical protein n=1 Tax=Burkholderia cepacia TaxID=292 RepID=UPI00264C3DDF|nr:hypothetical protein [Burkholderia cepacia]MDN7615407.1 hypothetical protein [Burkholderia cepacia]
MSGVAPAAIRAQSGGSPCIGRLLQRVVDNGHQGVAYPCFGAVDTRFIVEPFRRRRRAVVTAIGHAAASVSNASGSHRAGAGRNDVDYSRTRECGAGLEPPLWIPVALPHKTIVIRRECTEKIASYSI